MTDPLLRIVTNLAACYADVRVEMEQRQRALEGILAEHCNLLRRIDELHLQLSSIRERLELRIEQMQQDDTDDWWKRGPQE